MISTKRLKRTEAIQHLGVGRQGGTEEAKGRVWNSPWGTATRAPGQSRENGDHTVPTEAIDGIY